MLNRSKNSSNLIRAIF